MNLQHPLIMAGQFGDLVPRRGCSGSPAPPSAACRLPASCGGGAELRGGTQRGHCRQNSGAQRPRPPCCSSGSKTQRKRGVPAGYTQRTGLRGPLRYLKQSQLLTGLCRVSLAATLQQVEGGVCQDGGGHAVLQTQADGLRQDFTGFFQQLLGSEFSLQRQGQT